MPGSSPGMTGRGDRSYPVSGGFGLRRPVARNSGGSSGQGSSSSGGGTTPILSRVLSAASSQRFTRGGYPQYRDSVSTAISAGVTSTSSATSGRSSLSRISSAQRRRTSSLSGES